MSFTADVIDPGDYELDPNGYEAASAEETEGEAGPDFETTDGDPQSDGDPEDIDPLEGERDDCETSLDDSMPEEEAAAEAMDAAFADLEGVIIDALLGS